MNSFTVAGLPDFFAPGIATAFVLTVLRVGGLLLAAPVWSAKTVPMKLRTALMMLFAVMIAPAANASTDVTALHITPAVFLSETIIGLVVGLAAALTIAAAEFGGELVTTTIGLSGAAILDPTNNSQGSVFSTMLQLLALTVLLIGNGHVVMLQALAQSFHALPLGSFPDLRAGMGTFVPLAKVIFSAGLQFAGPVIAAIFVTNLALAILGRAAPQLQLISVAFPLQIGVGMITFAGSMALVVHVMNDWTTGFGASLETFARAARVVVR